MLTSKLRARSAGETSRNGCIFEIAGVGHPQVQAAVLGDDGLDQRLALRRVGDVELQRLGAVDAVGRRGGARQVEVGHPTW